MNAFVRGPLGTNLSRPGSQRVPKYSRGASERVPFGVFSGDWGAQGEPPLGWFRRLLGSPCGGSKWIHFEYVFDTFLLAPNPFFYVCWMIVEAAKWPGGHVATQARPSQTQPS